MLMTISDTIPVDYAVEFILLMLQVLSE
jgi:hypothetical protein